MIDSRCGLHCAGCPWRASHHCGGCVETNGNPFHGECPIAVCCQERGLAHCGECGEIPCEKLYAYSYLDPEHGDKPQGARIQCCRSWAAESGKQAWRNVLLTDSGWYRDYSGGIHKNILARFHQMLGVPPSQAKVLLIPTAAVDEEARPAAGKCFAELLSAGILPNHIRVHDIDGSLSPGQAMSYDAVYVTGGDGPHLLRRMRDTGFDRIVKEMVYSNKVYVGASAGSWIATPNIGGPANAQTAGLALIQCYLSFHCPPGSEPLSDFPLPHLRLSNGQALAVSWNGYELIDENAGV